jgi:hypothetical protein
MKAIRTAVATANRNATITTTTITAATKQQNNFISMGRFFLIFYTLFLSSFWVNFKTKKIIR